MSKKNKLRRMLAVMLTLVVLMGKGMNTYAATKIETSSTQFTNIYSKYSSFETTEGSMWWKKTHRYTFYAKFEKGYIIQLKNLSDTYEWKGANDYRTSLVVCVSRATTVSSTKSWSVTAELGFEVPVEAVTIGGKLGGSYTSEKTYQIEELRSSEHPLDKTSPKGYYAIVSAVKADLFNVDVTKDGEDAKGGKLLKYTTEQPYIMLRYSQREFD